MVHRRYFDQIGSCGTNQVFLEYMEQIMNLSPGKERRNLFKQLYQEIPSLELYVNIEGSLHTKYDSDLQRLLKQGFLKRAKRNLTSCCGGTNGTATVLVKA